MPAISVILPTYNSSRSVVRSIESVRAQSFTDWEVIVVDDASTDDTVGLLRKHYGDDWRVQIIERRENGGPSAARNEGLKAASGIWMSLLDSDDAWHPERLESLLSHAADADFIADNITTYDAVAQTETGTMFGDFALPGIDLKQLLMGSVGGKKIDPGYLKPMMRKSFLQENGLRYDDRLRHAEDFALYCDALCCGARFRLLNFYGYIYTTPVGRQSGISSPHSQTKADPVALSNSLLVLAERHDDRLSKTESRLLVRIARNLKKIYPWWKFEAALGQNDYAVCLGLFLRHWIVQRQVAVKIARIGGIRIRKEDNKE